MGEIIKILSSKVIKNNGISIELNGSHVAGGKKSVHIQSKEMRIDLSEDDFIIFSLNTLKAIKKLREIKGNKNE